MPLRVKQQIEPFTESSKYDQPVLAISNEYRRLYRDLDRYTAGQISGRSYLIAGHRGSGKTMLVHKAIEDLLRDSRGRVNRPLFVRLHGPDLLPPELEDDSEAGNGSADLQKGDNASNQNPANMVADILKCPLRDVASTVAPTSSGKAGANDASATSQQELVNVLTQMMKCLFRDVASEFQQCIREYVLSRTLPGYRRHELLEVVAQFNLEITECPSASRLRSFWDRIGALRFGVLFAIPRTFQAGYSSRLRERTPNNPWISPFSSAAASDDGMQEILVLSQLSQAFQVIAGKVEEKQKQSDAAKTAQSSSLSTAYALKNLFAPLAGLLTGGVVGTELVRKSNDPVTAVVLGLVTGAVVSFSFNYSSSRSRSRETSLESVFIRDRSVASLSGILPLLVTRLRSIGLAPVFVIDELDKVKRLPTRMQKLVQQLKYLVTENSFSCFMVDRRYLTGLNRQANEIAYAPEYTYFSDRLLVLYEPKELRKFVRNSLEAVPVEQSQKQKQDKAQQEKDAEDSEKIAYVIAHRARLHPIDLRRQIDRLAANETFSIEVYPIPGYRFEILMQVAIEWLLDGEDVKSQIAGNPDSRQVVYDALYYVSRLWEDASSAEVQRVPGFRDFGQGTPEKKPGFVLDEDTFSQYIESRVTEEESGGKLATPFPAKDQAAKTKRLSGSDFDLLFFKVRELLTYLASPADFYKLVMASPLPDKPATFILNAIPRDALLKRRLGAPHYEWLYDVSGRDLQTREVNTIIADVRAGISHIQDVATQVHSLEKDWVGLQAMADRKVIPRTPEWRAVRLAIDGLAPLVDGKTQEPYPKMGADRDCVVEYDNTLRDFEPNIKAALICGAIFAAEVGANSTTGAAPIGSGGTATLSASLVQISELLQLSASQEEDLRKLKLVYSSPYAQSQGVTSESEWTQTLDFVRTAMKSPQRSGPDAIIASAWTNWKTRFTHRFRDGTARFDPQFEDVFTLLHDVGPGKKLSLDLSTIGAADWSMLFLHSLSEDPNASVPPWLRVAACLEMGFYDLAQKLTQSLSDDSTVCSQWVRDAGSRVSSAPDRRGVLVLIAQQQSLVSGFPPSFRYATLVTTMKDLGQIVSYLKKQKVELPVSALRVELKGDPMTLGNYVTQRPAYAVTAMSTERVSPKATATSPKDLDAFLNIEDVAYFGSETPLLPISVTQAAPISFVIAPKSLDDLMDRFPDSTGRAIAP